MNKTKICSQCKQEKSVCEFTKNKLSKDGLRHLCKTCAKQYDKQYKLKHSDEIKLQRKKHRLERKIETKLYNAQYCIKNKDKLKMKRKQHRLEHRNEINLKQQQHRLEHKEELRVALNKHVKSKYETNPSFRILCCLRSKMHKAMKYQGFKKSLHTMEYLGCTVEFFKNYIQSLLKPGMTIENKEPRKWHLHHIKYCHRFNLKDPEQQKLCFHYTNIVPMWEDEHMALHAND